ncbi:hypothetical protein GQ602_003549 [Ophiocordyceps camponoti-floridani]|uniref:Uncharacterized protein n=1 Tax=Ophiocordyceps camponoti-floridani TaxID=2030778 RepID=A0A8H4Q8F8_9HYPO|nr:hypothetical protein GQ602_003549 [Ophiocordyceps camponoti-floridani]
MRPRRYPIGRQTPESNARKAEAQDQLLLYEENMFGLVQGRGGEVRDERDSWPTSGSSAAVACSRRAQSRSACHES